MPPTQTSCPAISPGNPFGTRPAVIRPLILASHPSLIYIYNETRPQTSGHLMRYDVATGQRAVIATSGVRIRQAQLSADGAWIMLLSVPDPRRDPLHVAMLQLVRLDGQGLQTLYCFPRLPYTPDGTFSAFEGRGVISYDSYPPLRFVWSPDERQVLLSTDLQGNISLITLLDIKTGNLRPLVLRAGSYLSNPSIFCSIAIPLTWLDDSHAYIVTESRLSCGSPPLPMQLYLLNVAENGSPGNPAWTPILSENVRYSDVALDIAPDGRRLLASSCDWSGPPRSSILEEPAYGGTQTLIYQLASMHSLQSCIEDIRVLTASEVLVLLRDGNPYLQCGGPPSPYQASFRLALLTLGNDGRRQLTPLTDLAQGNNYDLNPAVPFVWSVLSRDGKLYTMTANREHPLCQRATTAVYYGRLGGGPPVLVAAAGNGEVASVGWTWSLR
ncbi:hypothetical protein [Thermogemmatispora sp.]|uniref:hypothetical protein n=1 Tax=Thermogemmatispora sp. TaxID=1968838 RepID=UPI0035E3FC61